MQKIRKVILLILSILLINSFFNNCYAAAVAVTKENLSASLKEFVSSDANQSNYKITVSDDEITIEADGVNYTLNYSLTGKPKFTYEVSIEKGMSYKDFKEKTSNFMLPIIGYIGVANIEGANFEDASTYISMSTLENWVTNSWIIGNAYVIIDDTNMSDGVTIDKSERDSKTIYASEFGEKVMDYVNATYSDKKIMTDETSGINSYEWITEKKDVTETSCKLVSTLTVNVDADFSGLKAHVNKIEESLLKKDITKENADYPITLKVGQKCRIKTTEKITGHEIYGSGYDYKEINENTIEITATKVGKANGYIYIGETQKSFYITAEENTENKTLDTITLNINTTTTNNKNSENNTTEQNQTIQQQNSTNKDKATTTIRRLPKAGKNNIIYIIAGVVFIILITSIGIKLKKYKEIK